MPQPESFLPLSASSTGSACCLASSSLGLALAAVRNRRRKTLSRRGQIPPAISGMLAGT